MHGDEAVHAIKFGALLEEGFYKYDPHEFHGPTLNYFTLVPAWLGSKARLTEISETTLRMVPVAFGLAIILMLLLLIDGLGGPAVIAAALLTAVSPAMVFYSRYYIQEILLVCFTFGVIVFGYRYFQSKKIGWAIGCGVCLGLMHATKETWIIMFAAMLLAVFLVQSLSAKFKWPLSWERKSIIHLASAIIAAIAVSILFLSSFFINLPGIWDSVAAYSTYFDRAGGNEWHEHPWYFYLNILVFFKLGDGPVFSEAFILLLAIIGFAAAFGKKSISGVDRKFLQFIAIYSLIVAIVFSLIPYKTPWNLLAFWHGFILLAGVGSITIFRVNLNKPVKMVFAILLIAGFLHLGRQSYNANFRFYATPENPHVYAHPTGDVLKVAERIQKISEVHPDGQNIYIEAIFPGDDYWPFPWYLRSFPNAGWWRSVNESTSAAPIILCTPEVEEKLTRKLYIAPPPGERHLYVAMFDHKIELRPNVEMRAYVRKDLWDKYQQEK